MSIIIGINLQEREFDSIKFQQIISSYGCYIKTRIGLHDITNGVCAQNGLIILQTLDNEEVFQLINDLKSINNIKIEYFRL